MKRISLLVLVLSLSIIAKAQISGVKNIPGDYASLALAVNALNTSGVGVGGVTINLNQVETAPAGGYLLGSAILNPTTSIAKPIVINGGNNVITAQTGSTGTVSDAVFRIAGPDYVTINQLNIVENVANTTAASQMERGISIMGFTATDASQKITIQNCTINLNGTTINTAEVGILATNVLNSAAPTAFTSPTSPATSPAGRFDSIIIKGNTINNCYNGIAVNGGTTTATAANLLQTQVNIGDVTSPNIISGYGSTNSATTSLAYGIYASNTNNVYVSYNTLSATGLFSTTTHVLVQTSQGDIVASNNTISFTTAAASTTAQIGVSMIAFGAAVTNTARCDSNIVQNVTLAGTNAFTGISQSILGIIGTRLYCNNNVVNNISRTGVSGAITGIVTSSITAVAVNIAQDRQMNNNRVSNISSTAYTAAVTFNGLQWTGGSGLMKGNVIDNISLTNTAAALSTFNMINSNCNVAGLIVPHIVDSNTVKNVTLTGPAFAAFGITLINGSAVNNTYSRNIITALSIIGGGTFGRVEGIFDSVNTGTASLNINNNILSNFSATAANADNAIKGINMISGDATKNLIYHNTLYLGGGSTITSTGANFGVSGVCFSVGVTINNNIINISATPTGTGRVAAIRSLLAGTLGVISANFGSTSSNNILYAINATNSFLYAESAVGVAPVVFYNLTNDPNFNTSCSVFKSIAGSRGVNTYSGNNLALVSTGIYAPTGTSLAESNAVPLASVTTDIFGTTRPSTPDCGAVEFAGTPSDFSGPTITYTKLENSTFCTTLPKLSATITDASGVNVTAGTKPRIYFKKSTDNDAFTGNTNADNGWKFVEATNAASPFEFQMNSALLTSPVVANDTIQYFVVAQDLVASPNVGTNQGSYASGYCPTSVNLFAGAFPLQASPTVNNFTILSPNITLNATATPSITCINTSSTLTVVDTLTKMGVFPTGFTGPLVSSTGSHDIARIQIVGTTLNNSSTCSSTGGVAANGLPASIQNRYSNYTSTIAPVTLTNGITYTVNLDGTVCGTGTGYQMGLSAFIDLNRNGIFDMPTERVYANTAYDNVAISPAVTTKTFTFTIPSSGVVNGPTLMRFFMDGYSIGNTHTPSSSVAFGEVEDYQVYLNTSMAPTINSLANTAFSWSPALNVAPNPGRTVVASNILTSTIYTVTATDGGGCTYTKTASVDIAPGVLATGASGTKIICASTGSTTLTATTTSGVAPFVATWSGAGIVSTAGMSATLNPPIGTTTYSITVSDVCGFTSSTTVAVTVLPNPTAIVSPGNTNVCSGTPFTQTATGSSPTSVYTWMPGSFVGATQGLAVNINTTFTITATDGICSSTATFTQIVKSLPAFLSNTVVPSGLVCAGDSVQLTATAISTINEYSLTSKPYAAINPTGTPTVICDAGVATVAQTLVGLDNGTWTGLPIGFNFDYYGNNYTTFHLSTNGFITFGSPLNISGCCNGQVMPNNIAPNNLIALAWEDLDLTTSGKIDYFVEGVAPNRKLVIRYINVPRVGGASGNTTGQIILHETTNAIELQVQSVVTGSGDMTTMGIENVSGTTATIVAGRNGTDSWSATNEGWIFTKSAITGYSWASNQYINNVNINNPKVAPNYTTNYTVTATNVYGCTKTSVATVTVRNLTTGTLTPSADTICVGDAATFNGNVAVVCQGSTNNFQGYYTPANWTLTNSNVNPNGFVSTGSVPASIAIVSGSNQNANFDDGFTNYSKTIGCAGTVSFNWSYFTNDYAQNDIPYYSINGGTPIILPTFNVGAVTTPNTQTGVLSIPVAAGDVLTLSMYTVDNDISPGTLTISNFVAPAAPIFGTVSFWNAVTGGSNIGSSSITVSPTNTTTYYAQYTDVAYGCVNPYRDSVKVLVNPLPNVTATAIPDTFCLGGKTKFFGGNAITYAWTNGILDGVDFTPITAGSSTYTVTGVDANGCSNTSSTSILVNALPIVTASVSADTICKGSSAIFTGGGANTYTWSSNNGNPTNAVPFTPTNLGSTTYNVIGVDINNCVGTASILSYVNTLPTVFAAASATPICFGSTTILTGSGANTYTWTDGTNTPLDNVAYTPTLSGTTSYTVTGSDANTCTATSSVSVFVYTPTTFNNSLYLSSKCPGVIGGSVLVNANSGNPYTIAPIGPGQLSNGIFNNLIGGITYTVSSVDANMCTVSTTVSATNAANGGLSNATPLNILSVPGNFCQNQNQIDGSTLSYYGASCDNLIATVNDGNGGNTLGNVNACVTVLPTVPTFNTQPYLPRYYIITPQNQGPADITLYLTQDDFDDYNAAAGSYPQIPAVQSAGTATFSISQVPQGFLPGASGATTIVHNVTATWNATANRWEVTFPVTSFSGFYFHASNPLNSALPAAIVDFKGTKTETTDLITWSTTSELNNAHFNVLYSNNGKDFATLGTINSKATNGNSNQVLSYRFENNKPTLGHNYYKLEQVDLDGKAIVNTKVIDLMWGSNGSTVSIYPNPTIDELNIDIYTTKAQNNTIKLLDMSGRVVKEIQSKLEAGANNIKMNLGELATGIYTIQLVENNKIIQVSKVQKN